MPRFPRHPSSRQDPDRPHAFQAVHDPGIVPFAGGGGPGGQWGIDAVVTTSRHLRTMGCGLPGCGRPAQHPIHEPADDAGEDASEPAGDDAGVPADDAGEPRGAG